MNNLSARQKDRKCTQLLSSLDPVAKLIAVVVLGVATAVFPSLLAKAAILALYLCLSLRMGAFGRFAKVILGFGIPITVMLLLIQGCFGTNNTTIIADLGVAKLGLEGTIYALDTVSTLLAFLGGLSIMNWTTSPSELVSALIEKGVTPKAGYLVLASLNVVPQMQRRMSTIREAQSARGLSTEGGLLSRVKATIPLLGPVVLSSLTDAEERGMTLETHGFGLTGGAHTCFVPVHHSALDRPAEVFSTLVLLAAIAARVASTFGPIVY